ncbi:unnamed protein product [Discosporangium mesarthrocarpum]
MAVLGSVIGPALDAFHSRVSIVVYDVGKVYIKPLAWRTDIFVPPLLAAFFAVAGALFVLADANTASDPNNAPRSDASPQRQPAPSLPVVAASFGAVALSNQLSAVLYTGGVPYSGILAIMTSVGAGLWLVFDGTGWGLLITAVVAAAAPVLEACIMLLFGLWHYPAGDVAILGQSIVSFVPALYLIFTVPVGVMARYLHRRAAGQGGEDPPASG